MTTMRGGSNVFSFVAWINGLSSAIVTSRSRAQAELYQGAIEGFKPYAV